MTAMIADPTHRGSLSYRFRSKRDQGLRAFMLAARGEAGGRCRVVDLGGGIAYWERVGIDWLTAHGFEVTCINEAEGELTRDAAPGGPIAVAVGDACQLAQFADHTFDIVHSNSVIEHVGNWSRIKAFAREVRRLAPSYYVQTPNFWFPIDPHFYRVPLIHWMPPATRAGLHQRMATGWAPRAKDLDEAMWLAESNTMLSPAQMRYLFPDAELSYERLALLPKSIIATRKG